MASAWRGTNENQETKTKKYKTMKLYLWTREPHSINNETPLTLYFISNYENHAVLMETFDKNIAEEIVNKFNGYTELRMAMLDMLECMAKNDAGSLANATQDAVKIIHKTP